MATGWLRGVVSYRQTHMAGIRPSWPEVPAASGLWSRAEPSVMPLWSPLPPRLILQVKEVPNGDTLVIVGNVASGPPPEKRITLASLVAPRMVRICVAAFVASQPLKT